MCGQCKTKHNLRLGEMVKFNLLNKSVCTQKGGRIMVSASDTIFHVQQPLIKYWFGKKYQ